MQHLGSGGTETGGDGVSTLYGLLIAAVIAMPPFLLLLQILRDPDTRMMARGFVGLGSRARTRLSELQQGASLEMTAIVPSTVDAWRGPLRASKQRSSTVQFKTRSAKPPDQGDANDPGQGDANDPGRARKNPRATRSTSFF